jgi:hypothetical protein
MHDPPGAMLPADFFIALSSCPAHAGHPAARGRAAFSKRYGVLNQPLARMTTVRVRCITNKIAKILAFPVVYIHDAS